MHVCSHIQTDTHKQYTHKQFTHTHTHHMHTHTQTTCTHTHTQTTIMQDDVPVCACSCFESCWAFSDLRGDIRTHQEDVHPLCEMPSAFRRTAATSATLPTQTEVRHFSCSALVDGGGGFCFLLEAVCLAVLLF